MSHEEVDLAIVACRARAREIRQTLKAAGIRHVRIEPEHGLADCNAFRGAVLPGFSTPTWERDGVAQRGDWGPFHVRVRHDDRAAARLVLSTAGLDFSDQP